MENQQFKVELHFSNEKQFCEFIDCYETLLILKKPNIIAAGLHNASELKYAIQDLKKYNNEISNFLVHYNNYQSILGAFLKTKSDSNEMTD